MHLLLCTVTYQEIVEQYWYGNYEQQKQYNTSHFVVKGSPGEII